MTEPGLLDGDQIRALLTSWPVIAERFVCRSGHGSVPRVSELAKAGLVLPPSCSQHQQRRCRALGLSSARGP
jgi:hypothetical protein